MGDGAVHDDAGRAGTDHAELSFFLAPHWCPWDLSSGLPSKERFASHEKPPPA